MILAFLVTFAVSPVNAGSLGNGATQRLKLVVDSVDRASGTIVLKSMVDNSIRTYKINASTRVTVGRVKGGLDQIEVGQKVANLHAGGAQPPLTLDLLMLSPAVAEPASPAGK